MVAFVGRGVGGIGGGGGVAYAEANDTHADFVNGAGDVIAHVDGQVFDPPGFEVLRVGSGDSNLDDHLMRAWSGNRALDDFCPRASVDNDFFHDDDRFRDNDQVAGKG